LEESVEIFKPNLVNVLDQFFLLLQVDSNLVLFTVPFWGEFTF